MTYQWDVTVSDAPPTHQFNDIFPDAPEPEGEHTYLTESYLTPSIDIPGIPSQYASEESEGRALYVRGAPKEWENAMMRTIFGLWGQTEKLPVLISLSAEETFRWVVMRSKGEAVMAMEQIHGRNLEHGTLIVSKSLPPGRTLTLVKQELLSELPGLDWDEEDAEKTPQPSRLYHGHPPIPDTSNERTPTNLNPPINPKSPEVKVEGSNSEDFDDDDYIESPQIPEPNKCSPYTTPTKDSKKDSFVTQATSWANIAGAAKPGARVIDLKPENKSAGPRLKPVGRIPTVVKSSDQDAARLVFLFNLPSTITPADITNAVREGPLVKMQFGFDADAKARYCGVIFQHARDAAAFEEVLDKERREGKPDRFRFIVDHARAEQVYGIEDTLKAMGPPIFATRRLTIVKGQFFFIVGERQLRDICEKLVGEECIQLIWLYNGGNATIVFTDVSAAVRVKKDFDRRAARAASGSDASINPWTGVQTTFSKDPCVFPLELKTAMHD